ncbi:MAG: V-type ATPase subunit [Spirochaetes bacterium]|nr:V-type ATPase subunit [Spirochaetota bacterium]
MGSVSNYAYINARIHALISSLLTEDFFTRLSRSPSLEEALFLFQKTPYHIISKIYTQTGDLKSVEQALTIHLFHKTRHLAKHAPPALHPLISVLAERTEYNAFKTALRLWFDQSFRKRTIADYSEYIPREIPLKGITYDAIINSPDTETLISRIKTTPYCSAIPGLHDLKNTQTLLASELALENSYYHKLATVINTFYGKEKDRLLSLFADEIDEVNLSRLTRISHLLADDKQASLYLEGGFRITAEDFNPSSHPATDEILKRFGALQPNSRLEKEHPSEILSYISAHMHRKKQLRYVQVKVTSLFDAGLAFVYIRMCENEVNRIISALNSLYYMIRIPGGSE